MLYIRLIWSDFLNNIGIMQGYWPLARIFPCSTYISVATEGQQLWCLWHFESVLWLHLLMLWNPVSLMLDYMAVFPQRKLLGNRRTQIECSLYTFSLHNHNCRINCHWFTRKIATCFSTNWIIAVTKLEKKRKKEHSLLLVPPFQNILFHTPGWFHWGDLALAKTKRCCFLQSFPFSHWWLERGLQNSIKSSIINRALKLQLCIYST